MIDAQDLLSNAPVGEVAVTGEDLTVVFRRRYRKPVAKLWAALTTPERMAAWLADIQGELKVGGAITLTWANGNSMQGRIVAFDPPRVIAWTWPLGERETVVRFEVKPDGDGSQLTLTHSGINPQPGKGPGVRSGWHAHLEALPEALEGRATHWNITMARREALDSLYPPLSR